MNDEQLEWLACAAAYRSAGRAWRDLLAPEFNIMVPKEEGAALNEMVDPEGFPVTFEDFVDVCRLANVFFEGIEGMLVLPVPDVKE